MLIYIIYTHLYVFTYMCLYVNVFQCEYVLYGIQNDINNELFYIPTALKLTFQCHLTLQQRS